MAALHTQLLPFKMSFACTQYTMHKFMGRQKVGGSVNLSVHAGLPSRCQGSGRMHSPADGSHLESDRAGASPGGTGTLFPKQG